jgi:branched-chain amino acid transport system ATP-binding protein
MSEQTPVLEFHGVNVHFGPVHVLKDMSVTINSGELVCLLGGNASGKTTTLKTILGMVHPSSGEVLIDGDVVTGETTAQIVSRGVTMVPENRRLFKRMTVKENLEIGAYLRTDRDNLDGEMDHIFEMFPRVKERLHQKAGTLSGGEQQMVAVGRALMAKPKVLLMDEPSMGLSPLLVQQNFDIIERINDEGVTVFMVEQNANMALSIADRGYVLLTGRIVLDDTASNLLANEDLRKAYLGEVD